MLVLLLLLGLRVPGGRRRVKMELLLPRDSLLRVKSKEAQFRARSEDVFVDLIKHFSVHPISAPFAGCTAA